jgi:hypothetical protein
MNVERDVPRVVRSWLREDDHESADRVLELVLAQLDTTRQRRSGWPARRVRSMNTPIRIALAAAAVVVVAFVGLRFLLLVNGPGTDATPSPTVTAPPATPIAIPAQGELAPGSYVLTTLPPLRITFTVPAAGWQKNVVPNVIWTSNSEARIGFQTVDNLYADPCNTIPAPRDPPVGPTVDDLASALASMPGLDPATVEDVTFAGLPAKAVEIVATADQVDCSPTGYALWNDSPLDAGRTSFFVLDVDGTRLAIVAVERPGLAQPLRGQLQQILDSIRIEPS